LISVARLWRYPVKSLRGEACAQLRIGMQGAQGDRRYAVRDAAGRVGSAKRIDALFGLAASGIDGAVKIHFADGGARPVSDPGLDAALSAALGQPVRLAREDAPAYFDAAPLHLLTTASLAWLARTLPGAQADERRFRPNFVLQASGQEPMELGWIGRRIRIGDAVVLRVVAPTGRCRMVTLPQAGLSGDPGILRAITGGLDARFGVYAEVEAPGEARVGDPVRLD
jgi:uncharacterized protein YcbX